MSKLERRADGEGTLVYVESRKEYMGSIRYNGKRKYFYSGKTGTRKTVIEKMNAWRKEHNKEDNVTKIIMLDERISDWLTTIKQPALKPSSFDRLEQTVRLQIIPRLGDYTLGEITDQVIKKELIDPMMKTYAASTAKKAYDAMHSFLNYAAFCRQIDFNPMAMMKPPKAADYAEANSEEEDNSNIIVLDKEDRKKLREMAEFRWKTGLKGLRYPMGWAFILIMNTGMRMGEALALKWDDVDLKKKEVSVTKNMITIKNRDVGEKKQKLVIQNTPKSKKSRRTIPLNNEAIHALEQLKETPGTKEDGFIIHTAKGGAMMPRNFEATLTLLCKAAKIEPIGVHALRHTFASRLYEKGVDVKVISELLGHSSVDITYKIYIHVFEQTRKNATHILDLD